MAAACVELNREIHSRICTRGFTEMLRVNQENTMQHLAESNERLRNQKRMLAEDLAGQTKRMKVGFEGWRKHTQEHLQDFENEREVIKENLSRVMDRLVLHMPYVQCDPEMQSIIIDFEDVHNGIGDDGSYIVESETESDMEIYYGPIDVRSWPVHFARGLGYNV